LTSCHLLILSRLSSSPVWAQLTLFVPAWGTRSLSFQNGAPLHRVRARSLTGIQNNLDCYYWLGQLNMIFEWWGLRFLVVCVYSLLHFGFGHQAYSFEQTWNHVFLLFSLLTPFFNHHLKLQAIEEYSFIFLHFRCSWRYFWDTSLYTTV
jgi:hypothetical protein